MYFSRTAYRLGVAVITLMAQESFAQVREIKSFTPEPEIVSAYVDRADDFYLMLKTGEIQKYDRDGNKVANFKASKIPTNFDPANAMRLLAYQKDNQHFEWLTPQLESRGFQEVDSSWAIEPVLMCPSGDFNLWILDAADWSLRKVNPSESQVIAEFTITSAIPQPKIVAMREYLNFVFLLDEEAGIVVFNSIGKVVRKIEGKSMRWFNFLGEELYFPTATGISLFDLYTTETRTLPIGAGYRFVLLTDERMLMVSASNKVSFSPFKP